MTLGDTPVEKLSDVGHELFPKPTGSGLTLGGLEVVQPLTNHRGSEVGEGLLWKEGLKVSTPPLDGLESPRSKRLVGVVVFEVHPPLEEVPDRGKLGLLVLLGEELQVVIHSVSQLFPMNTESLVPLSQGGVRFVPRLVRHQGQTVLELPS
jgi:hypothetical protein